MRCAVLLVLVLLAPPVRHTLEATMTAQMLVQLPLLVAAGWLLSLAIPARVWARADRWNRSGIAGLALMTAVSLFWMLPRSLDAATSHPLMAAAKYLSVPLLIGLPFGVSWPRMDFVVRGVFLMEFVATFFRLGWLYLISPIRLCNNYAINDQQRLGGYMLAIGGGLLVWLAWKLLWGHFGSYSGTHVHSSPTPAKIPARGLDASPRFRSCRPAISSIENGGTSKIDFMVLEKLANALGVNAAVLIAHEAGKSR